MNNDIEVVYGLNPAFEVLRGGKREILEVLLNQVQRDTPRLQKLAALAEREGATVVYTDKQELFALAGTREHQGVAIKVTPYPYRRMDQMETDATRWLILDNIEDPHNLGAILRSAEIFGFHQIFVPVRGSPGIYPSVVKASAGATEHVVICKAAQSNRYFKLAQEAGFKIFALEGKGKDTLDSVALDLPEKICLVIGGEDRSVGQFILNEADAVIRIPQTGQIGSLNASVAAGIAMYSLRAQA